MVLAEPQVRMSPSRDSQFDAGIFGAVFADSGLLAVSVGDGTIQLVTPDGTTQSVQAHNGAVLCLSLDVDGLGFVSGGDDGRMVRCALDDTSTVLLHAPGRQIDVLAVSRPAKMRAVAIGREVRLLDVGGAVRSSAPGHPSSVSGLAFNPKGKRLAVAHYGGVTLWWTATLGQTPSRLAWRGSHIAASWSPDGTYLMTAMQERELHGWRVAEGEDIFMRGYTSKARSMAWIAKPPILVTSGADCVIGWSFAGSGPQGKPPLEAGQGIGQLVTQVATHPTRPLVAAGFEDGGVAICELMPNRENRSVRLRPAGGGRVSALAWSRDGTWLAVGTDTGALSLLELSDPAP